MRASKPVQVHGFYLVFTAITIFVLCLLGLLVLGLGLLTVNKSKTQNVANVVALAALSGFSENAAPAYVDRLAAGLSKANDILAMNRPIGSKGGNFSTLTLLTGSSDTSTGASGELLYGRWHFEDPDGGGSLDPCDGEYPCFEEASTEAPDPGQPDPAVNAARVTVRNQSGNDILAPFTNLLGYDGFTVEASATATIVQRCTAFLLDVSLSVANETHQFADLAEPGIEEWVSECTKTQNVLGVPTGVTYLCNDPTIGPKPYPEFYAYRAYGAQADEPLYYSQGVPPPSSPECKADELSDADLYQFNWCLFRRSGGAFTDPQKELKTSRTFYRTLMTFESTLTEDKRLHFRSDYYLPAAPPDDVYESAETTKDVDGEPIRIFVDKFYDGTIYTGPQPLASFLHAFNSGVRRMIEEQVSGDRVLLGGFAGKIIQKKMDDGTTAPGCIGPTTDLGLIAQLTNYLNLGVYNLNQLGPITWEYVPYSVGTETSVERHPNFLDMGLVPLVIPAKPEQSATHLADALYQASNQLMTACPAGAAKSIIVATDGIANCTWDDIYNPNGGSTCEQSVASYNAAEAQVVNNVLPDLVEKNIAVTTLVRGAQVEPHYVNLQKPPPASGAYEEGEKYYDFFEAVEAGCRGLTTAASCNNKYFVDNTNPGDINATPFSRALGLLVEIAADTGGIYCPLLDSAHENPYLISDYTVDGKLKDSVRVPNAKEKRALYNLSIPEQAADCALRALGSNPYILVD